MGNINRAKVVNVISDAPVDGTQYVRKDANWVASSSGATLAPTLSGVTTANENTDVVITIDNYLSTLTYVTTVSGGTFVRSGATITLTLPAVTVDTANTISVTAENVGISTVSSATVHSVNVINIPEIADQALVYDSTSMTEFTSLANTTATTTLDAVAINTTNIIGSSVVDSFDTNTKVVDGDTINVDGTDMVASGVTFVSPNYSVPTTSVTAGGIPTTAYINEHRAISNQVIQGATETDWNKIGTGSTLFEGKFEHKNISTATVADTLTTHTKIVDGDNLVIVKNDLSVNEVVASGITSDGLIPPTYSMDTTAITAGEIPSRVFATDSKLSFIDTVNGVTNVPKLSDSYVYSDLVSSTNPFGDGSLVAKYEMEGNVLDTLGLNNGTATNVTYSTGKFGQGAVFNGVNSSISVPKIPNAKTLSFFTDVVIDTTLSQYISEPVVIGTTAIFIGPYTGGYPNETLSIVNNWDGSWHAYYTTQVFPAGMKHIVIVDTGSSLLLYVDGVNIPLTLFGTYYSGFLSNIVNYGGASAHFLNGSIDQMEIYNKALTANEVNTLYVQSKFTNTRTYTDTALPASTRDLETKVELKADGDKMTSLSTTLYKVG